MTAATDSLVLMACGDIGPVHEPMDHYTTLARETLQQADIRIAQVERVYSARGSLDPDTPVQHGRVAPHLASIFSDCGFDIVSMAGNHAMGWGAEGLADTLQVFRERGIATVGAGITLAEARAPAFIERRGIRVAFLSYCSILTEHTAATETTPGVAPLRVHTFHEPMTSQPGSPPRRTITVPDGRDLANLIFDVIAARARADAVVLCLHWGVHFMPRLIAEYQPVVAEAAARAGAGIIIGHHAHVPKAVSVIDGMPCFYSLGNFVMSAPEKSPEKAAAFERRYGIPLDPAYPRLPYGTHAMRSLVARAEIGHGGVGRTSFLPVRIDTQLRPEFLRRGDPRFDDAVDYMRWTSEGHPHRFAVEGDEVVVLAEANE